jgi:hypothetical protein
MVDERSWEEFRESGLMWFINTTLHMFGWALVYDTEKKVCYPARVKYRGFSNNINSNGYIQVSKYMKQNADQLLIESKE